MNIFPVEHFKIRTDLTREEIQQRILDTHEYESQASLDDFRMRRVISYQNSFLPQIEGIVLEENYNARSIDISMKLHTFVKVFMIIWFAGIILFAIPFILLPSIGDNNEPMGILNFIPIFGLIFGVLLYTIPFKIEAKRSKKDLLRILDAVPST